MDLMDASLGVKWRSVLRLSFEEWKLRFARIGSLPLIGIYCPVLAHK